MSLSCNGIPVKKVVCNGVEVRKVNVGDELVYLNHGEDWFGDVIGDLETFPVSEYMTGTTNENISDIHIDEYGFTITHKSYDTLEVGELSSFICIPINVTNCTTLQINGFMMQSAPTYTSYRIGTMIFRILISDEKYSDDIEYTELAYYTITNENSNSTITQDLEGLFLNVNDITGIKYITILLESTGIGSSYLEINDLYFIMES